MPKHTPPGYTRCPHCANQIRDDRLEKHVRKVHRHLSPVTVSTTRSATSGKSRPNQHTIVCPYCGEELPKGEMANHQRTAHRPSRVTSEITERIAKTDPVAICPYCRLKMLTSQLKDHLVIHEGSGNFSIQEKRLPKVTLEDFHKPDPSQRGFWYRDSEGELCFGGPTESQESNSPAENELPVNQATQGRQKTSAPKNTSPGTASAKTPTPGPQKTNLTQCPICKIKVEKERFRSHVLEHPGITTCPACHRPAKEEALSGHMASSHKNWCPICHKTAKSLEKHLKDEHFVRPNVAISLFYLNDWAHRRRLTCYICLEAIAPAAYQEHMKSHALKHFEVISTANYPPVKKNRAASSRVVCPFCSVTVSGVQFVAHLQAVHPSCPHCKTRFPTRDLPGHIQAQHPECADLI